MTDFRIIDDHSNWRTGYEERRSAHLRKAGFSEEASTALLEQSRKAPGELALAEVTDADDALGYVAVKLEPQADGAAKGYLVDLWVRPGAEGHRPAALEWAERWCAEQGVKQIRTRVTEPDEPDELYADWAVGGQLRFRAADPDHRPEKLTFRPMSEAEYVEWLAEEKSSYARNMQETGAWTEAEARSKADHDFAFLLPEGVATPGHNLQVLLAEGDPVGSVWLNHGFLPGVTYGYGLRVAAAHQSKGYGRDAMAVGEQATLAGGDGILMFTVFGANTVAINLYTTAGYAVLDEIRSRDL